ncbi:hypothetical protein BFF94_037550 [Burkholderia catarinensis]|nr:hypothetical protein BFF94_037550 [Burkholderia catarinensis]
MARRTKEKALLTREFILDAGERLFIERGYRSVSLEEIAETAGVTRGALYWHFRGKGDLLLDTFISLSVPGPGSRACPVQPSLLPCVCVA